jgi:prepilin-type N-terminal cleavage/methylation domain-containing protein
MNNKQAGFTLIEIAIVLVIIGLLLGGVLKGQELIQGARVRNLISMQDGVKAAFFGFQDRFRAYPGDYANATSNINGMSAGENGDGDGQIETAGAVTAREDILAWEHLSRAGFITGSYDYNATPSTATNPSNPYGAIMQLVYDNVYADAGAPLSRHNLKTGNNIPSDILAEMDRKVDDGDALRGSIRFSAYTNGGTAPSAASCYAAAAPNLWTAVGSVDANCGAANLF